MLLAVHQTTIFIVLSVTRQTLNFTLASSNINAEIVEHGLLSICGSERLLLLAKKENIALTEEQAKEYFAKLQSPVGELSDAELDAVTGGGCGDNGGDHANPTANSRNI